MEQHQLSNKVVAYIKWRKPQKSVKVENSADSRPADVQTFPGGNVRPKCCRSGGFASADACKLQRFKCKGTHGNAFTSERGKSLDLGDIR